MFAGDEQLEVTPAEVCHEMVLAPGLSLEVNRSLLLELY